MRALLRPFPREPIRFFANNWDIKAFAILLNLAIVIRTEKTSVRSVMSGTMFLELSGRGRLINLRLIILRFGN